MGENAYFTIAAFLDESEKRLAATPEYSIEAARAVIAMLKQRAHDKALGITPRNDLAPASYVADLRQLLGR